MRVSCLMLTYNKFPEHQTLVEEALGSFQRQDYADKELIILNDAPGQVLFLEQELPNVTVVNLPRRARTLGEKCNIAAALATGDLLLRWDDDDIHLPHRISLTVAKRKDAAYWKPSHSFFLQGSQLRLLNGYMAACCIERGAFETIRGYPFMGVGEDQGVEKLIRDAGLKFIVDKVTPDEAFYIYRWGGGSTHVSGLGTDGYVLAGQRPVKPGVFGLRPYWAVNYMSRVAEFLARQAKEAPDEAVRELQRGPRRRALPLGGRA